MVAGKLICNIPGNKFDGDIALEDLIMSAIDGAHAAFADLAFNAIVTDGASDHQEGSSVGGEKRIVIGLVNDARIVKRRDKGAESAQTRPSFCCRSYV